MTRIAILACLKSTTSVCTGASCFEAISTKTGAFAQYEDDVVPVAFFQCNGCGSDFDSDAGMIEKMERIISIKPDVVHVGVCTLKNRETRCVTMQKIIQTLKDNNIKLVEGTHNSPIIKDIIGNEI